MEQKAKERILKIQKSQQLLQEAVGKLDRILYEAVLEKIEAITEDPAEIERIFRQFNKTSHVKVIRQFASGIMAIGSMNEEYFATVAENLDSKDYAGFKKQVNSTILNRFGLNADGSIKEGYYIDSFINDKSIPRSVREYGYKAQAAGLGYDEVKKGFKDLILGENGESGLYKNYYRTYAFDTYQQVDAAVQEAYSEKLGLKALMYLGGLMDTSRSFCEERSGKVYLKEEVEAWKDLKFQGKPKSGYNPFLDRGGYNCRHHLNYITDQMAVARRSDLEIGEDGELRFKGQASASGEPEQNQGENVSKATRRSKYEPVGYEQLKTKVDPEFWDTFGEEINFTVLERPSDENGYKAYYSDAFNEVAIGKGKRYDRSEYFQEKIVYHEYGHAMHFKKNIIGHDASEVAPDFKALFDDLKDSLSTGDKGDIHNLLTDYRYGVQGYLDDASDEFKKKLNKHLEKYSKYDISEMVGAAADTLEALDGGNGFGWGHGKDYFSNIEMRYAEVFAHASEIAFLENPIMKEAMPDVYDKMLKYFETVKNGTHGRWR